MESFAGQEKWIGSLIDPLNLFMEQTIAAFNKSLTISDNFAGVIQTVTLDGTFPYTIAWNLKAKPVSVLVGNVARADGSSFTLSSAVQVQWAMTQSGQFQITGVVGITPSPSAKYNLTLEIKAG